MHHIWSLTSLAQQYVIDASFRIDRDQADFIRKTQLDRRMVLPAEVKKAIATGLRPGEELGKIVLANKNVIGSFQWCQMMYQANFPFMLFRFILPTKHLTLFSYEHNTKDHKLFRMLLQLVCIVRKSGFWLLPLQTLNGPSLQVR